jgi:hypothetical protein
MIGHEPDMRGAKCNCPWNPDSHAKDCPIYARNYIDTLHATNQRLEVKCSLLDTARSDAEEKQWAAERENRRLEGEVNALREALTDASAYIGPKALNLQKRIDAALRGNGGEV